MFKWCARVDRMQEVNNVGDMCKPCARGEQLSRKIIFLVVGNQVGWLAGNLGNNPLSFFMGN